MTAFTAKDKRAFKDVEADVTVATGHAAAAFIASGIGVFIFGLLTTGAAASEGLKNSLNFWSPAGALSGKSTVAVLVWIMAWVYLDRRWGKEHTVLTRAFNITLILIALGFVMTFPPFFELFH